MLKGSLARIISTLGIILFLFTNCFGHEGGLQQFLDNYQYTFNNIYRYEKILGDGCMSIGGEAATHEFVGMLNLKSGQRVLDIGCGVGGADFYMARTFGVRVKGIDLSENMIALAKERSLPSDKDNDFEVMDVNYADFPSGSFDVVYVRETMHYINDKERVLRKIMSWLKPGGTLLITDYCCGTVDLSQGFKDYIKEYHYHFLDVESYGRLLAKVGFDIVRIEDRTRQFIEIHIRELKSFEAQRESFLKEFSIDDYYHIVYGWRNKIDRSAEGEQKWGLFIARKKAV